ncbi:MAG: M1 family metallopeptidase, partial [Bacteroidales bacterium]|nr:M1 family metallopeptidase [Bacteroidales bacterium]
MKNKSTFLILFLVLFLGSFAQEVLEKPPLPEHAGGAMQFLSSANTTNYDTKYHRFELEIDPAIRYIEGNLTTYFVPLVNMDNMYFDFRDNMTVDSVKYHGNAIPNSFPSATELRVNFPATLSSGVLDSVTIYYQGAPLVDGFGSFKIDRTTCSSLDSVMWTLSEPYGAKNWWPCKETLNDKIDSVDMIVTAPIKYHIGSNGLLLGRDTSGNKITDHWKHTYPIPAYLVAFAAAEYAIYSDTINLYNGGQLEVLNYVFPCDSAYAHSQTVQLDTVMNFFISKFGAYPYKNEKYGHAQCRFGGGMEHTTMTFMGGWWYYILIHELAHQWFGDKITCGSWQDIWLNEGFATYLEGLTVEQGIQSGTFASWLSGKRSNVLGNNFGSVFCDDTTSVNRIFNSRLSYNKGAYLLHMLRWIMGEQPFFDGLYNYINDTSLAYDYAKTADLQAHLEATADTSLTEFFTDWFYAEGWPDYAVKWSVDNSCNNKLRVNIQQTHSAGGNVFFEMPVPIRFSDGAQDSIVVFFQNNPADTLFFATLGFAPTT